WERFTSNEGESIESYYHRLLKLMNDLKRNKHFLEKIASNQKFLNNLHVEWSRHVTIVHQTKDLHTADYTQLYDFLKYNQKEVDELKVERLAKTQDPLALMANSNNPYAFPAHHQDQSSFNQNYLQQPMPNLEDCVWLKVRLLSCMDGIPHRLADILAFIIPISKGRSFPSIIARLLLAASAYFLWRERNLRLFQKKKMTVDQLIDSVLWNAINT
nr:reverse transcriptase domain, reverse transcriptase zinc-binding domain protein [Tanacetum cinerariifolium]